MKTLCCIFWGGSKTRSPRFLIALYFIIASHIFVHNHFRVSVFYFWSFDFFALKILVYFWEPHQFRPRRFSNLTSKYLFPSISKASCFWEAFKSSRDGWGWSMAPPSLFSPAPNSTFWGQFFLIKRVWATLYLNQPLPICSFFGVSENYPFCSVMHAIHRAWRCFFLSLHSFSSFSLCGPFPSGLGSSKQCYETFSFSFSFSFKFQFQIPPVWGEGVVHSVKYKYV